MSEALWAQLPPPELGADVCRVWDGWPHTLADVTVLRLNLRVGLINGGRSTASAEDVERLLLVFEELTSNGVRHGRTPVRVVVATTGVGWLIDVSDAATDRPPAPAVDRDAAEGGLGLHIVARLTAAHGWGVQEDRKHVWARVDYADGVPLVPRQRGAGAGPRSPD